MKYRIDKKTKITCTIGPSSESKEMMLKLLEAGMTCMRINFSHGTYEEHLKKINTMREIMHEEDLIIPICLDTKGPEIRTGCFEGGSAQFCNGDTIRIEMNTNNLGTNKKFGVTYKNLFNDCSIGNEIRLDDGLLKLTVIDKDTKNKELICRVENDHLCKDRRGVNCPGIHLSMPYLSKQDKEDLIFGCQNKVDAIFASFVRNQQDISEMRTLLDSHGGQKILIVSKVENTEAIENLDSIIQNSDGVMVARGDLGVEILPEEVPTYQKYIIEECRKLGKPVIVATQMMDSMINNPFPTRAEVSDVTYAIEQGCDSVMLSGESASGKYPIESVEMQSRIAREVEKHYNYKESSQQAFETSNKKVNDAIAAAVSDTAILVNAKLIICFSVTGLTGLRIAKTRPTCPVFMVCSDYDALTHAMMTYSCYPYHVFKVPQFIEEMEVLAIKIAKDYNIQVGNRIIITGGTPVGTGGTNFLKVVTLNDSTNVDYDD